VVVAEVTAVAVDLAAVVRDNKEFQIRVFRLLKKSTMLVLFFLSNKFA